MKSSGMLFFGLTVVSCIGIGAWLVVEEHPFFGLVAMIIGGCMSYTRTSE